VKCTLEGNSTEVMASQRAGKKSTLTCAFEKENEKKNREVPNFFYI
jgi:hypothetical protein